MSRGEGDLDCGQGPKAGRQLVEGAALHVVAPGRLGTRRPGWSWSSLDNAPWMATDKRCRTRWAQSHGLQRPHHWGRDEMRGPTDGSKGP